MNLRTIARNDWFNSVATCSVDDGADDLSVMDALSAAFDADEAGQSGAPAAPAAAPEAAAAPEPSALAETAEQTAERVRGPDGKFAKAPDAAPEVPDPTASQADLAPPETGTIRVPPGLSPATKAAFDTLPQHVRDDFARLQGDVETAKTTWDQKAQGYNRLDSLLAPARDFYRMRGFDDATRMERLIVAEQMLEKQPYEAIAALAQQVGVDLRRLVQPAPGQQQQAPQPEQPLHPAFQQILGEINTLKSAQAQQHQQQAQAAQSEVVSKIDAFKADPKNLYFENVKDDMANLIRSGVAVDLPDAYTKAIWANPTIRPLLLQAQQQAAQVQVQQQASAKADAARHASGSITGSPAPGAAPAAGSPATLRDALSQAWDAAA